MYGLVLLFALSSFNLLDPEKKVSAEQVKLTVIYGHPEDAEAFEEYYSKTHAPIAARIKGVSRMELTKFQGSSNGEKPPYYRMAELYFPSMKAMEKMLTSPEGKAALMDLTNFATGGTTAIVGTAGDFKFLEN